MRSFLLLFLMLSSVVTHAQQIKEVDFTSAKVDITINPYQGKVFGTVTYQFEVFLQTKSVFLDAKGMSFSSVHLNGKKVKFRNEEGKLYIEKKLKPGKEYELFISYEAFPKMAMYFIGWNGPGRNQIWTQGQGKDSSHWLPSFDDANEKVEYDLSISFDKHYEVISNGELTSVQENEVTKTWHYNMQHQMSSYLLAIAIGKYKNKRMLSEGGTPLELYYYPENEDNFEPTYRYTKKIFDFIEEETLTAYPWQNYKQIPVKDFLYAGMENTTATIFADSFVVDSIGFVDKNYINVNAHELAHQWFGDLVTAKSGEHHWLQEGFATYYALLAEKEIFGEDHFYGKLYESSQDLMAQQEARKATSLLDPKASSLTFYQKGAWVLHVLRNIVGDRIFRESVRAYLDAYKFKNVETNDFIKIVEKRSDYDLSAFVEKWIESDHIKEKDFLKYLPLEYLLLSELREFDAVDVVSRYGFGLDGTRIAQDRKIIQHLGKSATLRSESIYAKAFKSDNLLIRQALGASLDTIQIGLKEDFESLLHDDSYLTKELALYKLWLQYPQDRATYLQETEGVIGLSDKNVRLLWLTLALVTPEFKPANKDAYFKELSGYTSLTYGFEVRQNAFQYLNELRLFTDQNLIDLVDACMHHNWRFTSFSRNILKVLLEDMTYQERFVVLSDQLTYDQQLFLKKQLKNK